MYYLNLNYYFFRNVTNRFTRNMRDWPNIGLMVGQRQRQRSVNIQPISGQFLIFLVRHFGADEISILIQSKTTLCRHSANIGPISCFPGETFWCG